MYFFMKDYRQLGPQTMTTYDWASLMIPPAVLLLPLTSIRLLQNLDFSSLHNMVTHYDSSIHKYVLQNLQRRTMNYISACDSYQPSTET
mmetsp:Transcript_30197/g.40322  ORF Transcript_30197/g.40322 Transcript_30197/m.40322 type:complete len:89 (+) Transcript_30197:336-602(+)